MKTRRSSAAHSQTKPGKKPGQLGDFVTGGYRVWGQRNAAGMIRLAVKLRMIEFSGQHVIVIA